MANDSATDKHETEDLLCRWNVAEVAPDMMDLSDPPPLKSAKPFKPDGAFRVVRWPFEKDTAAPRQ